MAARVLTKNDRRGAGRGSTPRRIAILGSTGSIGTQALDVVAASGGMLQVEVLAARGNVNLLAEQAIRFQPALACVADPARARELAGLLDGTGIRVAAGLDGLREAAAWPAADMVLNAAVGIAGLVPTLTALEAGKAVALANKETLVAGGALVMRAARSVPGEGDESSGIPRVIPVDSEHSAVFQCLRGEKMQEVARVILTASGGPFRGRKPSELAKVTPEEALAHPNWRMGPKVTVDSATLMNKGLEVIEAYWLFNVDWDQIDVVVHPQSMVHSFVEFQDGSVLAQLGVPDMRLPIQYALTFPARRPGPAARLNPAGLGSLTFEEPDRASFPCLDLAYQAGRKGGTMPAVLNAANEEAVSLFLSRNLDFLGIAREVEGALSEHEVKPEPTLEDILEADGWARDFVRRRVKSR